MTTRFEIGRVAKDLGVTLTESEIKEIDNKVGIRYDMQFYMSRTNWVVIAEDIILTKYKK